MSPAELIVCGDSGSWTACYGHDNFGISEEQLAEAQMVLVIGLMGSSIHFPNDSCQRYSTACPVKAVIGLCEGWVSALKQPYEAVAAAAAAAAAAADDFEQQQQLM